MPDLEVLDRIAAALERIAEALEDPDIEITQESAGTTFVHKRWR
jgi:hypothetical protein